MASNVVPYCKEIANRFSPSCTTWIIGSGRMRVSCSSAVFDGLGWIVVGRRVATRLGCGVRVGTYVIGDAVGGAVSVGVRYVGIVVSRGDDETSTVDASVGIAGGAKLAVGMLTEARV
jgi:hypothetical protein